tara:strand:- start:138 stop:326 length:189 start_codon:yes stop_codon:yes gene_type:complete
MTKKKEKDKNKSKRSGLVIKKFGDAATKALQDFQKTSDSERSKTMDLKDRIRKERNKRIRER